MLTAIDTFASIVASMPSAPRFYSDNWDSVAVTMRNLGLNKANDGTHYPLIVLDTNYNNDNGNQLGVDNTFNAKFYFIDRTEANYNSVDRENLSYKANLYPLMDEFLYYTFRSTSVIFDVEPMPKAWKSSDGTYKIFIPKTIEKLPFMKGKDAKQNKLNAIVDALSVEITIKIRNT